MNTFKIDNIKNQNENTNILQNLIVILNEMQTSINNPIDNDYLLKQKDKKIEALQKKCEELQKQLQTKNDKNTSSIFNSNTSTNFPVKSEIKKIWEEIALVSILDTFIDYESEPEKIFYLVNEMIVIIDKLINDFCIEIYEKVSLSLNISKNDKKFIGEVEKVARPLIKENLNKIFIDTENKPFIDKFITLFQKSIENFNLFKYNQKDKDKINQILQSKDLISMIKKIKDILLYTKFNDQQLFFKIEQDINKRQPEKIKIKNNDKKNYLIINDNNINNNISAIIILKPPVLRSGFLLNSDLKTIVMLYDENSYKIDGNSFTISDNIILKENKNNIITTSENVNILQTNNNNFNCVQSLPYVIKNIKSSKNKFTKKNNHLYGINNNVKLDTINMKKLKNNSTNLNLANNSEKDYNIQKDYFMNSHIISNSNKNPTFIINENNRPKIGEEYIQTKKNVYFNKKLSKNLTQFINTFDDLTNPIIKSNIKELNKNSLRDSMPKPNFNNIMKKNIYDTKSNQEMCVPLNQFDIHKTENLNFQKNNSKCKTINITNNNLKNKNKYKYIDIDDKEDDYIIHDANYFNGKNSFINNMIYKKEKPSIKEKYKKRNSSSNNDNNNKSNSKDICSTDINNINDNNNLSLLFKKFKTIKDLAGINNQNSQKENKIIPLNNNKKKYSPMIRKMQVNNISRKKFIEQQQKEINIIRNHLNIQKTNRQANNSFNKNNKLINMNNSSSKNYSTSNSLSMQKINCLNKTNNNITNNYIINNNYSKSNALNNYKKVGSNMVSFTDNNKINDNYPFQKTLDQKDILSYKNFINYNSNPISCNKINKINVINSDKNFITDNNTASNSVLIRNSSSNDNPGFKIKNVNINYFNILQSNELYFNQQSNRSKSRSNNQIINNSNQNNSYYNKNNLSMRKSHIKSTNSNKFENENDSLYVVTDLTEIKNNKDKKNHIKERSHNESDLSSRNKTKNSVRTDYNERLTEKNIREVQNSLGTSRDKNKRKRNYENKLITNNKQNSFILIPNKKRNNQRNINVKRHIYHNNISNNTIKKNLNSSNSNKNKKISKSVNCEQSIKKNQNNEKNYIIERENNRNIDMRTYLHTQHLIEDKNINNNYIKNRLMNKNGMAYDSMIK